MQTLRIAVEPDRHEELTGALDGAAVALSERLLRDEKLNPIALLWPAAVKTFVRGTSRAELSHRFRKSRPPGHRTPELSTRGFRGPPLFETTGTASPGRSIYGLLALCLLLRV